MCECVRVSVGTSAKRKKKNITKKKAKYYEKRKLRFPPDSHRPRESHARVFPFSALVGICCLLFFCVIASEEVSPYFLSPALSKQYDPNGSREREEED
jgi:hypothetical protein